MGSTHWSSVQDGVGTPISQLFELSWGETGDFGEFFRERGCSGLCEGVRM